MRITRTVHDSTGRAIAQWDPRLFLDASAPANLQTTHTLSGAVSSTNSVDAGWRVALLGEAGQPIHNWDGWGSQRWMRYDAQLRPVTVFEQPLGGEAVCAERLSYGASDPSFAERNQCGQLIRHDDPAGTQLFTEFGLSGAALEQTWHFLKALALSDWPEPVADRDLLLEPGEGAISRSHFNALGEAIEQTDAKGHRQLFNQTLDGQLHAVSLQLNGTSTPKTLVSAIDYNAHGQTEQEVAGNGVITTLEYDAQDGRLTRLQARRCNAALQDLRYAYDPLGNVLSIEDAALPIRYFANQRIEPVNRYAYDSLSQLIEATGWEAGSANKGPQISTFDDPAPRANYRQTYRYDSGGNLLELNHEGPQSHGHRLVAAVHSNRCLPVLEGVEPGEEDFRRGFDGNGNLLSLQPGQRLHWDLRNQLCEVQPVGRDSGRNDRERYVYGADGMRVRKVRETQTNARTLIAEVRYLPSLELRTDNGTGEVLQVISVQAGRGSVRVLHWESAPHTGIVNDQYRYHLNDHLGSCTLELDKDGEVISQERYHPYGTTAWFGGCGEVEASYRTVRYSGKERDATGLYYYGFRYYIPWWQRWLNTDPSGPTDGLNVYGMVKNNPVSLIDEDGLNWEVPNKIHYIWIGDGDRLEKYAAGLARNAKLNPGHDVFLHIDTKDLSRYERVIKTFEKEIAAINVVFLRENNDFFNIFKESKSFPVYSDLVGAGARNFSAASDVLRYPLIDYYGGVYSDTDDVFTRGIREGDFSAKRGRVFTMPLMKLPWGGVAIQTSSFAAHANNSTLKAISGEIVKRYKNYGGGGLGTAMNAMSDVNERMSLVSNIMAPDMLTSVLTKRSNGFKRVVQQSIGVKVSMSYERHGAEVEKRMPMSRFIETGNAHSWDQ